MFAIARIADKAAEGKGLVEISGINLDITNPTLKANFMSAIAKNYGGSASDYYITELSSTDETKIRSGDEYDITWDSDTISGTTFAKEETKKFIEVTTNKTEIDADGVTKATLTITIIKADDSGTDTTYQDDLTIKVNTPEKSNIKMKLSFSDGVASKIIKSAIPGEFVVPIMKPAGLRIKQAVTVDAVL